MQILRQSDPRWGHEPIGRQFRAPYKTFGGIGCLETSFTMAANELLKPAVLFTPKTMQDKLLAQAAFEAFDGVLMCLEPAAHVVGLVCKESERLRATLGDPRLPHRVLAGLGIELEEFATTTDPGLLPVNQTHPSGDHGLCILHVAINAQEPGASQAGQHFILAWQWLNGKIQCADPATGAQVELDDTTLTGQSMWGHHADGTPDLKTYRVVGTIPIRRAA